MIQTLTVCHPWHLNSGNPCRNDGSGLADFTTYTATRHNLRISLPLPPGESRGEGEIQKLRLCRVAV